MSSGFAQRNLMKTARLFDLALVSLTFFAAFALSSSSLTWPSLTQVLVIRIKVANLFLFIGYLALCSAVFWGCGFYRSQRLSQWPERLYEIFLAVTVITAVLWLLRWPLALEFATQTFLLFLWLLTLCTLILAHEIALYFLHLARRYGRNLRNIVIVGDGPNAAALASRIRQEASLGYRVIHIIDVGEITENGRNVGDL
jgi:FlaA1/EpsC-like NDP-sugar epimerase